MAGQPRCWCAIRATRSPRIAELTSELDSARTTTGSPRRDLLASAERATRLRRRDRERRRARACASATTIHGRRPGSTAPRSRRPIASATAPPAMSAPRPSRTSSATRNGVFARHAIRCAAAGGIDPEDIEAARRDAPAGLPHAGARRHGGRLCRGGRAPRRRAAGRGDLPLDRQLAHRVRHGRPLRRRRRSTRASRRGCAAISNASAWPATTSRSTRRASCRSTSRCTSASSPTTSAAHVLRAVRAVLSQRRAARRPPRRCSTPTTSPSASRVPEPHRRGRAGGRRRRVGAARQLPAPGRARPRVARDGVIADRPAGDRAARQRPEFPRARRCARGRRRQMSGAQQRPSCSLPGQRNLRLLRRHRARARRRAVVQPPAACRRSPIASATHAQFTRQPARRACRPRILAAGRAAHARRRTTSRIGLIDAVACAADVLTFYQERIANESFLRTATRARLAAGDGQARRLSPASRRRGGDLARLRAGDAAAPPPRPAARAGQLRHRHPDLPDARRRAARCRACPVPTRSRRPSRRSKRSTRAPSGTPCALDAASRAARLRRDGDLAARRATISSPAMRCCSSARNSSPTRRPTTTGTSG